MSVLDQFLPSHCKSPREKILNEKFFLARPNQNYFKKCQFGLHKVYMSHQRSVVHQFFLLMYKSQRKIS